MRKQFVDRCSFVCCCCWWGFFFVECVYYFSNTVKVGNYPEPERHTIVTIVFGKYDATVWHSIYTLYTC